MERADTALSAACALLDGAPLRIGVIDTGIYPHVELRGLLQPGWDFLRGREGGWDDNAGHGTAVAGIIKAGICKRRVNSSSCLPAVYDSRRVVSIIPLKVAALGMAHFDRASVVAAISYAQADGIRLLNLCDGFDEYDAELDAAVRAFPGLIICSAGNDGRSLDDAPRYPQCLQSGNIICVGALRHNGTSLPASNYGSAVTVTAPGERVPTIAPRNRRTVLSGTSAAAPAVTADIALHCLCRNTPTSKL